MELNENFQQTCSWFGARHEHLRHFLAPPLKPSVQAYEAENCAGFLTNASLCCLSEDGSLNSVCQNKRELNLEADKIWKPKEKKQILCWEVN